MVKSPTMRYAKKALVDRKLISILPCGCTPSTYSGAQHLYALCKHGNYILLSDYSWDKLGKEQSWIGPSKNGHHE